MIIKAHRIFLITCSRIIDASDILGCRAAIAQEVRKIGVLRLLTELDEARG